VVRARPSLPTGHGELLTTPDIAEWAGLLAENAARARRWTFEVAGVHAGELRALARREALDRGAAFSSKLGVPVRVSSDPDAPIAMTGHQPGLYHPGVWIKDFLLQRIADQTGATAIDVAVDSDGFDEVALTVPCLEPVAQRCRSVLATASADACYACAPVPSPALLDEFRRSGMSYLTSLPAPAVAHHFETFCGILQQAALEANSLGELLIIARRRYEAPSGTDYLELPLASLAQGRGFAYLVVDLALRAREFAGAYNSELGAYRASHGTRSVAQPFPDLELGPDRTELPLWVLADGTRSTAYVEIVGGKVYLTGREGRDRVPLPAEPLDAVESLTESGMRLAPKALTLTLFLRLFVADLFIHGVGGARYDRVTDGVIRRFFGIEPPAFVVASLTMYLPLGARMVTDEELADIAERRSRFEHNPDDLLEEADFETDEERAEARRLAAEKAALITEIALPGADRKELGKRIREVNAALGELLGPLGEAIRQEERRLKDERAAAEVLTDRNYPFCLWSPEEVADKAR